MSISIHGRIPSLIFHDGRVNKRDPLCIMTVPATVTFSILLLPVMIYPMQSSRVFIPMYMLLMNRSMMDILDLVSKLNRV